MPLDARESRPFESPAEHLETELQWLAARLAAHVRRLRDEGRFNEDPFRGLYLRADDILGDLERPPAKPDEDSLRSAIDRRASLDPRPPLARIAADAGLDAFERLALVIVAAPALDRRFRAAFAFAQNDAGRSWPSVNLLAEILAPHEPMQSLGRFAANSRLMANGLLQFATGEEDRPLSDRALSIDDRVVEAIAGIDGGFDRRIAAFVTTSDEEVPKGVRLAPIESTADALLLLGDTDVGQRLMAAAWCRTRGRSLLVVDAAAALASCLTPALLASLAVREAMLSHSGLMIDGRGEAQPGSVEAILKLVAGKGIPVAAAASPQIIDRRLLGSAWSEAIDLDPPGPIERARWWRHAAGTRDAGWIGWQTRLGPDTLAEFSSRPIADVRKSAAAILKRRLPQVLQYVPPRFAREDLVLSAATSRQVDELIAFARHRPKVLGQWGFGARGIEARRCVALLAGPSGCGKTMCASIVARCAGVELHQANLAAIFDKYIGETEKGIDRLFSAAADAGIAILFDEADVLFGRRTETHDSHDRYANLSTAFILQRLEQHDGLVMLSSNLAQNMDAAFARRLTHSINFSLPDPALREILWRHSFPSEAQLETGLPWKEIARTFELSGGNIRNASLAAAYLAASDGTPISLDHLLRAITREFEKSGRTPIAADFGSFKPPR